MDLQVDWAFDWKEAQKRSFFAELTEQLTTKRFTQFSEETTILRWQH